MVRSEPRRRGFFRSFLALLLLIFFAAVIVLQLNTYLQVGEVQVPDVVGSDVDDARRALRNLGFEVSTYTDTSLVATPDSVTNQTPAAGAVVRRGRGIALGVSARERSSVPNLVGLNQTQAADTLTEAQLGVGEVTLRHAPQAEGTVLSQRPGANSVARQAEVDLTVSLGPRPQQVRLPRVVGLPLGAAQTRLSELGFRRIETVPTRLGRPGVNAQQPQAGTPTEVSAQVTLYYTLGDRQIVPVPSIIGLDLQRAAERLQAAGLRVGRVTTKPFDPAQPAGISSVQPPDYTLWGTAVDLATNGNAGTYRVGPPAIPPAQPFTQAGGQRPLGAQPQLSPSLQPNQASAPRPSGSILVQPNTVQPGSVQPNGAQPDNQLGAQSAQPAQTVQPTGPTTLGGQPVELPATGGRTIPISYDPADYAFLQGRPYGFQVQVSDAAGERIALDREMGPDEPVQDTVTVYGEAEVRMYIDGQIIFAYNPPNS